MVFGLFACYGETFGLDYRRKQFDINENSVFMMRSTCIEVRLMGRSSEVTGGADGNERIQDEVHTD